MQGFGAGKIKKGFIDRQRLDQRCERQHARPDFAADRGVMAHARADHHRIRAPLQRLPGRHRRPDAIAARDVACRRDHAALAPADDHRPVADRRVVAFFDRGVERVAIHMRDGQAEQLAAAAHVIRPAIGACRRRRLAAVIAAAKAASAQHLIGRACHPRLATPVPSSVGRCHDGGCLGHARLIVRGDAAVGHEL